MLHEGCNRLSIVLMCGHVIFENRGKKISVYKNTRILVDGALVSL